MDAVLIWSWDGVDLGRNGLARQLALDSETFWAGHASAGRSSRVEWLASADFSAPHMMVVRGDFDALSGIAMSPDYMRLAMRSAAILRNVRQSWHFPGESSEALWATWWEVTEELEGA